MKKVMDFLKTPLLSAFRQEFAYPVLFIFKKSNKTLKIKNLYDFLP